MKFVGQLKLHRLILNFLCTLKTDFWRIELIYNTIRSTQFVKKSSRHINNNNILYSNLLSNAIYDLSKLSTSLITSHGVYYHIIIVTLL